MTTLAFMPAGAECDHSAMTECCPGCGHLSCPCGITWDEGSEGEWDTRDGDSEYLSTMLLTTDVPRPPSTR